MLYQIRQICGKNESATCSAAFEQINNAQPLVCFDEDENRTLDKKKKSLRKIRSTRLGAIDFQVESALNKHGERIIPEEFRRLVPKGKSFSYDTIWDVTRMHFLEYRQRTEIQKVMPFPISTGSISNLYKEGLAYIRACHEAATSDLKKYYRGSQKPFVILMDGTNEGGRYTHFQMREGNTNNTLLARRIVTENQNDIEDMLKEIEVKFGRPDAVIADMASSGINAVENCWNGEVPLFICQFHFLRDLGNDMLREHYRTLRKVFFSSKITQKLNVLRGNLVQLSKNDIKNSENYLQVIAMIDWIFNYSSELNGQGVPFDLPWKSYYERCSKIYYQNIEILKKKTLKRSRNQVKTLNRLQKILNNLFGNSNSIIRHRNFDKTWQDFMDIRALFWDDTKDKAAPLSRNAKAKNIDNSSPGELAGYIEEAIKKFRLEAESEEHFASQKKIYRKAAEQLEKYKKRLSNHIVVEGKTYALPRTNNMCEVSFRDMKRQLRRTNGKKNLVRVLDHTPVEIMLIQNVRDEGYRKVVFGDKEIHEVFAEVPADTLKNILQDMASNTTKKVIDPEINNPAFLLNSKLYFLETA